MRVLVFTALAGCGFQPGALPSGDARAVDGAPTDATQSVADAPVDAGSGASQSSIVIQAEDFFFESSLDLNHHWTKQTSIGGFGGTGYITATPGAGDSCAPNDLLCGAVASYSLDVPTAGTWRVTVRHASSNGCCDSVFWSFGLGAYTTDDLAPDTATTWTDDTTPLTVMLDAGMATFNLRMRESGARVDSIRFDLQ